MNNGEVSPDDHWHIFLSFRFCSNPEQVLQGMSVDRLSQVFQGLAA